MVPSRYASLGRWTSDRSDAYKRKSYHNEGFQYSPIETTLPDGHGVSLRMGPGVLVVEHLQRPGGTSLDKAGFFEVAHPNGHPPKTTRAGRIKHVAVHALVLEQVDDLLDGR